nr:Chain P, ANTIGEN TN, SER IS COVALENTLY BOUND TO GALNAC [Homo sapiens]
APDSRP